MLPPPQAPADPYDVPASPTKSQDKRTASRASSKDNSTMTPNDRRRDRTATPRRTPRSTPRAATKEIKDDAASVKKAETAKKAEPKLNTTENPEEVDDQDEPSTLTADEGASQLDEQAANPVLEIDSLTSHRVDKDAATVDFLVTWEGGEASWESEYDLQTQAPKAVFDYWNQLDSREDATGLDVYHVFKILKRMRPSKGNEPKYHIQWVGYGSKEATWEPESKLKEIAPEELKAYEAKHGVVSDSTPTKKRPSGRGPGRPRKRVKQAANGTA